MSTYIEKPLTYDEMKNQTGLVISYEPVQDGSVTIKIIENNGKIVSEITFDKSRLDEAHILYTEVTELLRSRAKIHQDRAIVQKAVSKLFASFRGEKVDFSDVSAMISTTTSARKPSDEFIANPGKKIDIVVDGVTYQRLPVRTRTITLQDKDILPILNEYVGPYLKSGDLLFISEKALTITQGRVVDMSTISPTSLARFLARNVGNNYGSNDFRGFGHGTTIAMQLFIQEAGYMRVLFAAAVSAMTRPFGIRGFFYRICGKRAKSVDCPMSFLILEYAHSAKLAPNNPNGEARRIKKSLNPAHPETIILDANYRGAFSLGKTSHAIPETFIGKLFADNPLGQSDEMTPFCIVRRK